MNKKRNTVQKGIVFETFEGMHNHPSAGMVYKAVHEKYPEISKATVYRLLAEAAERGEVLRLKLSKTDDRYDVTVKEHSHIICRCCGAVADVDMNFNGDIILSAAKACENFLIEGVGIEFTGLCQKCAEKINLK